MKFDYTILFKDLTDLKKTPPEETKKNLEKDIKHILNAFNKLQPTPGKKLREKDIEATSNDLANRLIEQFMAKENEARLAQNSNTVDVFSELL